MADPITNIKRMSIPDEVLEERNLSEVKRAVSENKDVILKGIDLLGSLNKNGTLDFINALLKQKDVAMKNIIQEMNKPQYAGTFENLSKLFFFLGEIKVDDLNSLTEKVNLGMEEALATDENNKTSYMGVIKALKDPEINRSVTMLLNFLRGMGKE